MAVGRGVSMSTAIVTGFLSLATVVGFSVGLGIEGNKSTLRDTELNRLRREIKTVEDITKDINVTPPNGFIN
ncbi:hypothetical protein SFBSU_003G69 [Candidatus Arthromitus sp. SFB-mouse-SU]|uniref:hypothetical protein n=1 Tax=Candidatus Arthromitus sp. SFB-mouse TaxID=49118 RepID=UPI000254E237|nr:hypothetical protein [Candidatus Arthromitus sp. SFB-mouse]EIA22454.1 hypothetical protein SFB2_251G5 [Candidatus Arthromitus sp. SFB-2]EIA24407.1 hypothetical protein SFB3_195G1 [Candidatus Arthromitus sp. SFB-3]EIA25079.1 hypothetical protein SFB1_012G1 [Candidatus Arthromitus sp. SFB-1]EIA27072.1 hypothetical protein SFB6_124G26 [Candidatus Arthromitus sp. SFB-co]EIA31214.1 hypothetical protein SFBSU_003G69 [Candidatus Arthromitus sp. SFB-mouse-SU]EIA31649.1 hypothetical protein SFB4_00